MGEIADTIAAFEGLITKPTLKEKLLGKPPFRFLHDIITNLQKGQNFPPKEGFAADQLVSSNVKEKDQKIAFLEKLIKAAQIATGSSLDVVKPMKIVAGLEPENTNLLLQKIAEAARNCDNLDLASISAQMMGGDAGAAEEPEPEKAPSRKSSKPSTPDEPAEAPRTRDRTPEPSKSKSNTPEPSAGEGRSRDKEEKRKPRRRSSSRDARPPSGGAGGGGGLHGFPTTRAVISLPEASGDEEYFEKTARMLGACINRPKLSEKLLRKPPFRFLHDIITNCAKATGFPEGLFSGDFESFADSKSCKETKDKLLVLARVVGYIATATGRPELVTTVNPKKIAAGLEPENTNMLLQALAEAAASGCDGAAVLSKFESQDSAEEAAPKPEAPKKPVTPADDEGSKGGPAKALAMPKLALNELKQKDEEKNIYAAAAPVAAGDGAEEGAPPTKLSRPRTARRAPPKLPSNLIEENGEGGKDEEPIAGGVILDGMEEPEEEDEEEEEEQEVLKGFNDMQPEDGQHGKLVNDILKAQGKGKETEEKDPKFGFARLPSARKAQNNSLYNSKNIQELRQKIQKICQSANPLGKIIDFVYEDMDTMNKELVKWRRAHQTYLEKFEDEKKITVSQLEPLTSKLADVTAQVAEQTKRVHTLKANILRNDSTIQNLLESHSAAD